VTRGESPAPIKAIIRRLRREPFNCSTRDILDMSPAMIRDLLSSSDDEGDRRMAGRVPTLPPQSPHPR